MVEKAHNTGVIRQQTTLIAYTGSYCGIMSSSWHAGLTGLRCCHFPPKSTTRSTQRCVSGSIFIQLMIASKLAAVYMGVFGH
jgi:hypothetical protein